MKTIVKRTQRDYNLTFFKLSVVDQVEMTYKKLKTDMAFKDVLLVCCEAC